MAEANGKVNISGGVGFPGLLTLVFVVAKLFDKIDWSWWWVFSPLWIGALLGLGILAVILLCALISLATRK